MLKANSNRRQIELLLKSFLLVFKKQVSLVTYYFAKVLQKLPLTSETFGPPKSFVDSGKDYIKSQALIDSKLSTSLVEVNNSVVVSRKSPKTLDTCKEIHIHFKEQLEHKSPSTYVASLPNARVWGDKKHCAIISPEDFLIADVSKDFGKRTTDHSVFRHLWLGRTHKLKGKSLALVAAGGESFYHWLFHVLPRVGMVKQAGIDLSSIDWYIVNGLRFPYHYETLEALGIPIEKVIEIKKYHHVKVDELIIPSFPQQGANVTPWVCEFFRKSFLDLDSNEKSERPRKKIYISRQKALQRRIVNHQEVSDLLKSLDFEEVFLEDLPYLEQAKVFSGAEVILSPHGAGLAHLSYCKPGTKVAELFGENYVGTTFWILSEALDLDYYHLICTSHKPFGYMGGHPKYEDLIVEIDSLMSLLGKMGLVAN